MTSNTTSGNELLLKPAERMVPINNWFLMLNNIAEQCINNSHLAVEKNGYKYKDIDFWRVIVFKCLNSLNTKDASDELDDIFYGLNYCRPGRPKKEKTQLKGKYPRFERLTPNESQINGYIRKLPCWVRKQLTEMVFRAQMDYALESGILDRTIEVYIDYTNKFYYGEDDQ